MVPEKISIKEKLSKQKIKKLSMSEQTTDKLNLNAYTTKELTDEIKRREQEEKQNYINKICELASNNTFIEIIAPEHYKTQYSNCSDNNVNHYSTLCLRCCLLSKTFDLDMILKTEMVER